MADAGVGETMLLAEAGSEAAGGATISSLGAGGAFVPAAGESAGLFSTLPAAGAATAGLGGVAASQYAPELLSEAGTAGPQYSADMMGEYGGPQTGSSQAIASNAPTTPSIPGAPSSPNVTDPEFMKDPLGWIMKHQIQAAGIGLGGYALANILSGGSLTQPRYMTPYQTTTAQQMGLGRGMSSAFSPQRNAMYNAAQGGQVPSYASGGSLNVAPGSVATSGVAPADLTAAKPDTGIMSLAAQYGINPAQVQQGISALKGTGLAAGGSLGGYSDGGQMLKGGGDGMSDSIPATISGKQPARLADGEFVVPADVVSHLGNGSTDAGAKQLYSMMNKVRKARTGNPKQGKQIKAEKYLPK
jgi:hypothetical protein